MQWNKRVIGTSVSLGILALAVVSWLMFKPMATVSSWKKPTPVVHTVVPVELYDSTGHLLSHLVKEPALVVIPKKLPSWARQQLTNKLGLAIIHRKQFLWNGQSHLFHAAYGWHIQGLHPIEIEAVRHSSTLTRGMFTAFGRADSLNIHPTFSPSKQGNLWATPLTKASTTLNQSLIKELGPSLPAGSAAVVLEGNGAILGLLENPYGRGLVWQPHPVGLGLVPPLLSEGVSANTSFAGLASNGGQALLSSIASRWGMTSLRRGLHGLGVGHAGSVPWAPISNPKLPTMNTQVMAAGKALWVTPVELARSYIPFVDKGAIGSATLASRQVGRLPHRRIVSTQAMADVNANVPTVVSSGVSFHVWRPDGNFSVVYTAHHGGYIMVLEGSATQNTIAFTHALGKWVSQRS